MKILYIHQYFKTPLEPGGTRSYWVSQELINRGYEVTMLTSSNHIESSYLIKYIDGIKVIYLKVPYDQHMGVLSRAKAFLTFMFKSLKWALKEKNVNLVVATSTPLTVGFPALLVKFLNKKPYIFEVRDLWPEVPIQMGVLSNPLLQKLAVYFEKTIYKNAKHVIALSPGMADGVLKFVNQDFVSVIPNMSKNDIFFPKPLNIGLIESFGLQVDSFKIVHFGSLGISNGAISIIESAKLLKQNNSIVFIFIGGGATEMELKNECKRHSLFNVHFLGEFDSNMTSEIVNFCDVSIVSFLDIPILYTNSPNKFFDSLSAGKPIIVNSAGWTKDLVEKYQCGFYVNPNNSNDLVDKILFLQNHPNQRNDMGNNSRRLAESRFDKSILCKSFADVVEKFLI